MTDRYLKFFDTIHSSEGDFSNHPLDKGGRTIYGIAEKSFPAEFLTAYTLYLSNKKELLRDYVKKFYYKNFYHSNFDRIEDESLAFKLFDFGINASPHKAIRILQKVINKHYATYEIGGQQIGYLNTDGFFGISSLTAVNGAYNYDVLHSRVSEKNYETKLYNYYVLALDTYYKNLWNFSAFGKGWLRRLRMIFNNGKLEEGQY